MPWCPQCDEMFPEGPSCPRCRTPLVEMSDGYSESEARNVGTLPQLKVPRRLRKAFDKLNRPAGQPRHLMGFTFFLLVFAGGLVLGRIGSVPPTAPVIRFASAPLPATAGSLSYVAWPPDTRSDPVLVRHDLGSGAIHPVHQFTLPFPSEGHERTHLRSLGGSAAFVVSGPGSARSVGAAPSGRAPLLWLDGVDAAWASETRLLVRQSDSRVVAWSFVPDVTSRTLPGLWSALYQTPSGAFLEGSRQLAEPHGNKTRTVMSLPEGVRVIAPSPDGRRVLVESEKQAAFWDGTQLSPVETTQGHEPLFGSWGPDAATVAVTFIEEGRDPDLFIGLVWEDGKTVLRTTEAPADRRCAPEPVWESSGTWVYVAPGNGTVRAVEVGGGRLATVQTRIVACGLAWSG